MRICVLIFAVLLVFPVVVQAESGDIGLVKTTKGNAVIERGGQSIPAQIGLKLKEMDVITTEDNASLGIILRDNSVVSIGPSSRLELSEFVFKPAEKKLSFVSKMFKGTAVYLTGLIAKLNSNSMKVVTPTAIAGVRGTRFAISVEGE